jgi:hypothetical protein
LREIVRFYIFRLVMRRRVTNELCVRNRGFPGHGSNALEKAARRLISKDDGLGIGRYKQRKFAMLM